MPSNRVWNSLNRLHLASPCWTDRIRAKPLSRADHSFGDGKAGVARDAELLRDLSYGSQGKCARPHGDDLPLIRLPRGWLDVAVASFVARLTARLRIPDARPLALDRGPICAEADDRQQDAQQRNFFHNSVVSQPKCRSRALIRNRGIIGSTRWQCGDNALGLPEIAAWPAAESLTIA
jgi:hypothetical protein